MPFVFTQFETPFPLRCLQLLVFFGGAKVSLWMGQAEKASQVGNRCHRRQRVCYRLSIPAHFSSHLFWDVLASVFVRDLKSWSRVQIVWVFVQSGELLLVVLGGGGRKAGKKAAPLLVWWGPLYTCSRGRRSTSRVSFAATCYMEPALFIHQQFNFDTFPIAFFWKIR